MSGRSIKRRDFLRESAAVAALPLLGGVRPSSHGRAAPEQLYRWSSERLQAGRCYSRAAELLEQAVAARPEEPRYREALACAYFDRALEISTWLRRRDLGSVEPPPASQPGTPPLPEALEAEALEAARKALAEMREATCLAPDNAEIHHTRGWILTLASLFQILELQAEDGLSAFETAVRLAPLEARYHRSLGDVLFTRTPLRDGIEMPAPAPGDPPPRISPEVFRRLMPGLTADQMSRWSEARARMLNAYRQAAELRPSDGFLHYTLFGLCAALQPDQPSQACPHLEAARRLLPADATLSYEVALLRYRSAAEAGSKVIPVLGARQALREGNRIETRALVWAAPEYPPLLAAELRRLPLQDLQAMGELQMRLRALAREAVADAEALRKAGDLRAATSLLDEVLRLGERLIGDPQAV